MIDILVPVLSRPQNAAPLVENIRAVTEVEHRIIFLCSPEDEAQKIACLNVMREIGPLSVVVKVLAREAGPGDYAKKINLGQMTTGEWFPITEREDGYEMGPMLPASEWLFMGADDLTFEPRWDHHALKAAGTHYDVVGTNDHANGQVKRGLFGTHCLIRRRYVTELGGTADGTPGPVLWEGYDHNFVDRELCHVAQSRGRFVFARHSNVRHRHPLWRTAPHDATYRKALKHFREDQRLFLSRAHLWGHAGLSAQERRMAA